MEGLCVDDLRMAERRLGVPFHPDVYAGISAQQAHSLARAICEGAARSGEPYRVIEHLAYLRGVR